MKEIFSWVFVMILILAGAAVAQTELPPVQHELAAAPDSPIAFKSLEFDSTDLKHPVLKLFLENVSQKTIRAGVIGRRGPGLSHSTQTSYWGTFTPGKIIETRMAPGRPHRITPEAKAVLNVDFVLFDDGTTWGEDKLGQSEMIVGYYDGRKAATDRVRALADSNDTVKLEELFAIDYRTTPPPIVTGKENLKRHRGLISGYSSAMLMLSRDYKTRGIEGIKARLEMPNH